MTSVDVILLNQHGSNDEYATKLLWSQETLSSYFMHHILACKH